MTRKINGLNSGTLYVEEDIQTAFAILQRGIIDREKKSELKKLREAIERIGRGTFWIY